MSIVTAFVRLVRDGVVARVGLNLHIDITMSLGPTSEMVEVKEETPLLEMRTPEQALNLSGEFVRRLPLSTGREWSDFLLITPGVNVRALGPMSVSYAVRGSDFGSNVIQVDGANLASAAIGSTATVNIVPAAIADVKANTAALDAAAPLESGSSSVSHRSQGRTT